MMRNKRYIIIPLLFLFIGVTGIKSSVDFQTASNDRESMIVNPLFAANVTDDSYEDNDDENHTAAITPGTYELMLLDPDWFTIEIGAGNTLAVYCYFFADDDYDLYIYDNATGDELGYSWYANPEYCQYTAEEDMVIAIYVDPYYVTDPEYTLRIREMIPIPDDQYEDNNFLPDAAALPAESATYEDLVCYEADFFSMDLKEGQILDVDLIFNTTECDLDLTILNEDGTIVTGSYLHGDNTESISYNITASGTYYIKVVPFHLNIDTLLNQYDLEIVIGGEAKASIPGYTPFLLGLAAVSTIGFLIIRKRK
jgi:hypothetical protein